MVKNRISELRRELGLNQKELGDKLGVGQTTVSAWETGKNEPDYQSIRTMAALFEVSADYLLGFDDDHIRRGLSLAEFETAQERITQQIRREKQVRAAAQLERAEELEKLGVTQEELEEELRNTVWTEWMNSGIPVQFETYQVIKMMESASKPQREAALEHVSIVVKRSIE